MIRTFTLICALAAAAFAQPLSGVVKDPSGALVSGAAVSLQRLPRAAAVQTTTDAQGRFRFDSAAPGSYTVSVTKDGFEPWVRAVTIADKPIDLGVSLKLKVLAQTVQVSGKRSPLANSDPNYIALRGGKLTKVYRVENLALTRDVGVFTFRSGSFSFLPPVLGRVVAGVFVGDGNFQLRPASEMAAQHLRHMAGVDSVDEDFTAMVAYFTDSTFDEIKQRSELVDEAPEPHQEAFQRVKKTLEHRWQPNPLSNMDSVLGRPTFLQLLTDYEDIANYEAEILAELYNPAQRGSFRAFLHGRKHPDLRFLLNPRGALPTLPAPEETALLNFDPSSFADGVWYLSHLASEVKDGRASSDEDKRLIAPEHYKIQAFIGAPNLLGSIPPLLATCDLRFRSLEDGSRMVKFELFPDLQMSRVAWDGKEIPFVQESRGKDGSFYLQMPEPMVKGQTYQLTFEYSGGEIVQSMFSIPPRRIWYPIPAGPATRATYDLLFHIPRGMTIVSVGREVKRTRDRGFDVVEWSSDVPIAQAAFRYLGNYLGRATTDEATKMDLAAYVPGGCGICPKSEDVLTGTANSVRVFTDWFGPAAYNQLSVVVGGSKPDSLPGLLYMGFSFCVLGVCPVALGPRLITAQSEVLPLQVADQWWGNTVNPASFHDQWLSSGFADFSASLYDQEVKLNPGDFGNHWQQARENLIHYKKGLIYEGEHSYCAYCSNVRPNDTGPLWMGALNETSKTTGAADIVNASKGGYVLHMLRSLMWNPRTGDADFQAMMRDFVGQFTNRVASTEDFQSLVEKHMKRPMDMDGNHRMDWFFNDWVYGTDVPSYRLEYSLATESGGKRLLTGKLTQSGVSPGFKMIVPVFAELAGQKVRVAVMAMRGNSTRDVKAMLPEAPKRILLNVNHDVLTDKEEVKLLK